MFAALLPAITGIVFRHVVLSGLGSALVALNLSPEVIAKITELVQALGPIGGTVLGLALMGGALGWSFYQKKKSGVV